MISEKSSTTLVDIYLNTCLIDVIVSVVNLKKEKKLNRRNQTPGD